MSALQWALLILAAIIVVALIAVNRRERHPSRRRRRAKSWPPAQSSAAPASATQELIAEAEDQLDIFGEPVDLQASAAAPPPLHEPALSLRAPVADRAPSKPAPQPPLPSAPAEAGGASVEGFDEYGVGRPRRRVAPRIDAAPAPAEPAPEAEPRSSGDAAPEPPVEREQAARSPPFRPAPPAADPPQKIVSLMIVAGEGAPIPGAKLHRALRAQGLRYGARQIYHRMNSDQVVFSVANLVKPGVLVPERADGLQTPGLSVFMVLPGPTKPVVALQDMIGTAQTLARALDAEVYDAQKMPLTPERVRAISAEVESWARAAQV